MYGEVIVPHLVEYTPPAVPASNVSLTNATALEASSGHAPSEDELDAARARVNATRAAVAGQSSVWLSPSRWFASATGEERELAEAESALARLEEKAIHISWMNDTFRDFVVLAPNASFKWGYGAAVGMALQGVFKFEQRWCVSTVAHCIGVVLFGAGAMQHALLTNAVMASTRGKAITDTSPWLVWLVKWRQRATDMAPIILLATPLLGQMFSSFRGVGNRAGQHASLRSILKESGAITSAVAAQWSLALIFAVFYGTWVFDFWVASLLS
jgi:hypothetical protein